MGQVRHGGATTAHTIRASIMRACPPLVSGPALRILRFARGAEPRIGHQPGDGGEMAQAGHGRRPENQAEGVSFNGAERGRISNGRGGSGATCCCRSTALRLLYALQPSLPHLTRSALHR